MTPELWERVKALFQSALELPAAERAAFLAAACGDDAALRQEVELLLRSHDQAGSFIEKPAVRAAQATVAVETPPTGSLSLERTPAPSSPKSGRRIETPRSFSPGDVVADRYRVVRYVAEGAMGEVYEVEDLSLHGHVALKTIRPEIAEDARAISRFKREIHVARKVTHPNVCRIYDLGTHRAPPAEGSTVPEEILFLTMELLAGETLSDRIARAKRLTTDEALTIVAQIAAGLDAAHAAGVLHRDFKSGNVMLVPADDPRRGTRAVITDFGLARGFSSKDSLASISDSGVVVGTPAYMAPEQVQGLELTPAADLYALGIVMYEMVTGVRPFDGGSAITVAVKRLTVAPQTPRVHVPDLDPRWESVILRCLERNPTGRFASAMDILAALRGEAVPASGGVSSGPGTESVLVPSQPVPEIGATPAARRGWRVPPYAIAASVVLALGLAAYALWSSRQPVAPVESPASPPPGGAAVTARRVVAVLGLKNVSGRPDAAWLSTAISEMLTSELAAGGKIRVVPGDDVAVARRDLGLDDVESPAKDIVAKVRRNLDADLIVFGSYTVLGSGDTRLLRIDLRLVDADGQSTPATATGTEAQLFDLVSRAGTSLRERLGLEVLSPSQAVQVEAALPSNREAARLYADGLARLQLHDALGARDALEKAVAADPKHPLPHHALAEAWSLLGYEARAQEEAKKAAASASSLPSEAQFLIEGRGYELARNWEKAIETYRSLATVAPDNLEHGLRLAEAQVAGGKAREALVTIETLRKLPRPLSEDPRIDVAEARALKEVADFRRMQASAARAAEKAAARGARLLVARARLLEANAQQALGDGKAAEAAIESARALYEATGDRGGLARTLNEMAVSLSSRGDLGGARRLFEKSLAISREIGDSKITATVLHNLGSVLLDQGNVAAAQKLYDESLATFRRIGAKLQAAYTLNDIGARLQGAGDLAGAQKRYQEALALFGEIGEKQGVGLALTNVAEVLFVRGDLKQSQDMHEESLAICREIGDKAGAAYNLYRLGEVFAAKGDLRVAKDKYEEAVGIQQELGDKIGVAQTRLGLAALALAQGHASQAETIGREAEEVARSQEATDIQGLAQALLAEALLAQGKLADARTASDEAVKISEKGEDRHVRLVAATTSARVRAASRRPEDVSAALQALERARAEAAKAGFLRDQYEATLALGTVEIASGKAAAGKARLQALAKAAEAKGFGLLARKVQSVMAPAR